MNIYDGATLQYVLCTSVINGILFGDYPTNCLLKDVLHYYWVT